MYSYTCITSNDGKAVYAAFNIFITAKKINQTFIKIIFKAIPMINKLMTNY